MSSDQTIGVVIPAYNAAAFINATLASVAAQERAPDQVVVVDDVSSDQTAAIARTWSDKLPLEVVQLGVNVGCGPARHIGLERLRTARVALLDADDIWFPDHLAHIAARHDELGGVISPLAFDWWPGAQIRAHAWRVPQQDQLRKLVERSRVFSGVLMSLADYHQAGGFRDRPLVEDWDLWLRMAVRGVHFHEATTPTVLYRRHQNNVTQQHMQVLEAAHRLISEHAHYAGIPAEAVARSLRSTEAEMALQRGAELLAHGKGLRGRRALMGGFRGRPKLKVGTLAALLSPTAVAQRLASRGYTSAPVTAVSLPPERADQDS